MTLGRAHMGSSYEVNTGLYVRPMWWSFVYGCVVFSEWKKNSDKGLVERVLQGGQRRATGTTLVLQSFVLGTSSLFFTSLLQ